MGTGAPATLAPPQLESREWTVDESVAGGRAWLAPYLFLAPALLILAVFFFLPVAASLVLSFSDFDLYAIADRSNARWVGFANYRQLLDTPLFWKALHNTLYFALVGGPLSIAVSLGTALLVNARLARFRGFFRAVYFAPVVTTLVAVSVVWRYLLHERYGLLNYGLAKFGVHPIDWLGDPRWAMPAIILLAVWKNFGYNMIIFVAGLQNVPEELYEAARIDGAGAWARFYHVTLPQLAPTFLFVSVLTMIGFFQIFSEPYVMTQGGPLHATRTLVLYMYEEGFRWWHMGYAASVAFVLFVLTLLGTLVQLKLRPESR